ncbi:hypothetical protein EVAR_81438_1 [Eumeta japonica]|uniref:Uncharacterized protein n=1 Tax=Eumeta variegata TaxID=151549 RepID=A0A4C1W1X0_EUMVA|nr:hypothetical protein EVAR_81438_1 [Eumeta japonica]
MSTRGNYRVHRTQQLCPSISTRAQSRESRFLRFARDSRARGCRGADPSSRFDLRSTDPRFDVEYFNLKCGKPSREASSLRETDSGRKVDVPRVSSSRSPALRLLKATKLISTLFRCVQIPTSVLKSLRSGSDENRDAM